jgi:hypothetical protein
MVGAIGAPNDVDLVLRGLSVGAVAVIGNAYWRLHRSRIQPHGQPGKTAAQDLFWGQVATLWARWAIVVGGALLVLSQAATTSDLALEILPVVALLATNFYLHGRYLLERPANAPLTLLACGLDLALVAALFLTLPGATGLGNATFVFLYPLVFAVGLVFAPRLSWPFTAASLVIYTVLVLPAGLASQGELKVLVVRLVTLTAMGGLGTLYWRIVRRESRSPGAP